MDTRVFPDIDALSRAAMDALLRILQDAIAERGRFAIALAGGHTPAKMYALWAREQQYCQQTPWGRVHLFFGDERYVPQDDPLSNFRMAKETLIAHVPIPAANVYPMPTDLAPPDKAAAAYNAELRQFFGQAPPEFDLQLLGLGTEGHTASLFPGSSALDEKNAWVAAITAPVAPPLRLTLTPVILNRAKNTFFLVAGENKRQILSALRNGPEVKPSPYPAARIRPSGAVLWFLDQPAAG